MYHLQIRQFPNHATRFNLSEREVFAVLAPWSRQQIVELGERKWAPERATLTVLEGPELDVQQLAMGRGWRAAERSGVDVTERVLAATARALEQGHAPPPAQGGPAPPAGTSAAAPLMAAAAPSAPAAAPAAAAALTRSAPADPLALAVQLAALLGEDPERLLAAWREVAARSSGLAPSEALALAERQLARPDAGEA